MRKITFLIGAFLCCTGLVSAQSTGAKVSKADSNWSQGGIYSGYQPSNEILHKRTSNTKHFKNADGSETAQIGGLMHFEDKNGYWQDIDLAILKTNGYFGFSNESNNIKSYFPETSGGSNVMMKVSPTVALNWWKSPKLELTAGGSILKTFSAAQSSGKVQGNSIVYHNVYPGISEEFETSQIGLENNTIINFMSAEIKALPANAFLEFSQIVELGKDWKIVVNGKSTSQPFIAADFSISIPGFAENLSFSKIVVFDNEISKAEALFLVNAPKNKLSTLQIARLEKHVVQINYKAEFVNGNLQITTKLPVSWLQKANRSFPVTIDPTVTVGTTTTGNFYGPLTHWYGFQRNADLYLQSEIGGFGNITSIEYYKTGTQPARTKPAKVYMRTTTATLLAGTFAWNSAIYTGGLTPLFDGQTTQDATEGWKMVTLTTPFAYASGNLLVMVYDQYGGGGSAQYLAQASTGVAGRQAFRRADNNDPGDASATSVEDRLQTIRITYSTDAPAITSFTPSVACSSNGTVVITGSGFLGTTAVTVGGTPVTSFVINNATQITAVVGTGTTGLIQVTNPVGNAVSATNLTINPSPVVAPISGGSPMVCLGQTTAAFTNATSGGSWSVVNGTGSASISAAGVLTGIATGNVIVMYAVTNATCTTSVSTMVTIVALPPVITISPENPAVCSGTVQALTVAGSDVQGETTIGNDNTLTGDIEELTAFSNRRANLYFQMIFTAAELSAAGIISGNITSMAFNITTLGSNANNANYTIMMGATTANEVTAQFTTTGLSTVFGPAAYTHAPGWNTFTFATPYLWDGTSNIIIQVSHDGIDSIYNAETYFTQTTNNTIVYKYNHTGPLDAGGTVSKKRFNTRFNYGYSLPVSWTPVTNLYTDLAATTPYTTGMNATTVYAMAQMNQQYTATITNANGCSSAATSNLTLNSAAAMPTGAAQQEYTEGQTLADLIVVGTNLQWYSDAAGEFPIANTTVLANTTYYVSQTPAGECESNLLAIEATPALATNGFQYNNFSYYPNPVTGELYFKYTRNITSISLFNVLGQQITFQAVNAASGQLDMSKLATGIYLIKVTADNQTATIKVMKN